MNDNSSNELDSIIESHSSPTLNSSNISGLSAKMGGLGPIPNQAELFHVEKQIEHEGVEMGVLENAYQK